MIPARRCKHLSAKRHLIWTLLTAKKAVKRDKRVSKRDFITLWGCPNDGLLWTALDYLSVLGKNKIFESRPNCCQHINATLIDLVCDMSREADHVTKWRQNKNLNVRPLWQVAQFTFEDTIYKNGSNARFVRRKYTERYMVWMWRRALTSSSRWSAFLWARRPPVDVPVFGADRGSSRGREALRERDLNFSCEQRHRTSFVMFITIVRHDRLSPSLKTCTWMFYPDGDVRSGGCKLSGTKVTTSHLSEEHGTDHCNIHWT